MVRVIIVHGRNQFFKIPEDELLRLAPSVLLGLGAAGYGDLTEVRVRYAYYGDLYEGKFGLTRQVEQTPVFQGNDAFRTELAIEMAATLQQTVSRDGADAGTRAAVAGIDLTGTRAVAAGTDLIGAITWLGDVLGLGDDVIDEFLRDMDAYLDVENDFLRRKTIDRVMETIHEDDDDIVLIGYSLGSVVALDVLLGEPNETVKGLLTVGAVLGMKAVQKTLRQRDALRYPESLPLWSNVYNVNDLACGRRILAHDFKSDTGKYIEDVDVQSDGSDGVSPSKAHDFSRYLEAKVTGNQLKILIESEARPSLFN